MTSNLNLVMGNHLEDLAGALGELLSTSATSNTADLLQPETIVVQSKGMQRWISLAVASQNGICANVSFPFPNAFLESAYSAAIGKLTSNTPFDPDVMTFRIMDQLKRMIEKPEFAPVKRYVSSNPSELKWFQLSRKIADVFDQYLVFRPDMIAGWETKASRNLPPEYAWQSRLWRKLRNQVDEPHRADLQKMLIQQLADLKRPISNLPPRVSVFGISHLPIFHLQVLEALACRVPVYVFLLNPCRQYWADIVSDRQLTRSGSKTHSTSATQEALHLERGNRLLASWGQQGRQFFGLTHQLEGQVIEIFEDNQQSALLGRVQQEILDLKEGSRLEEPGASSDQDESIQIHVCHSPMREVEVLHDQLLHILDSHPDLHPGDIMVMTPDISRYAPYVHAVFGRTGTGDDNAIPYTLADQSMPRESRLAEGFLHLLQLSDGRFEVSQIMALLDYAPIRRRFGIAENDLGQIETWIREANIRWGWDAGHRKRQGLPRYQENTWRAGLDRLLLGYAMSADQDALFAGINPHSGIEGGDSQALGALIQFAETLHHCLQSLPQSAPLNQWRDYLYELIEKIFDTDEATSRDFQALRGVVERLSHINASAVYRDEIPFEVVRQFLSDSLNRTAYGTGFMAGDVTFCAMLPMRSIPAKVICILGMDHDAFPQDIREPAFNLIASEPIPGDRSKRDDDKYLFLEALLSARRIFYLSYVGRDIQDNAVRPPSVLVDELKEYLIEDLGVDISDMVTEHPLQAFSPAYFDNHSPRLFSYSRENRDASRHLSSPGEFRPFFDGPIPIPDASWRNCRLSRLCRFYEHPVRFLMEQRLGIFLADTVEHPEDIEPFNLNPLENFLVGQKLLRAVQKGLSHEQCYRVLRAAGQLPHGVAGRAVHDEVSGEVMQFSQTLEGFIPGDAPQSLEVEIDLSPFQISGKLEPVYPRGMVMYRLAKLRPKDLMTAFIRHLALCLSNRNVIQLKSYLICKDAIWEFNPPSQPDRILQKYLDLYWEGLQSPLLFFSLTSFEYAFNLIHRKKGQDAAKKAALKKWHGSIFTTGEYQDAYLQRCFRDADPLTPEFESLSIRIFDPLFASAKPFEPDA